MDNGTRRLAALLMPVALIASACVQGDDPSVSLVKLDADVVFGVDLGDTATPPNIAPAPVAPSAVDAGFELPSFVAPVLQQPPFRNPAASRLPPLRPSPTQTQADECPPAAPTATARDVVEVNISGPPQEGLYRWQREGTQTIPNVEEPVEISGFDRRVVQNYEVISDTVFEFETVQTKLDSANVIISKFRVNTDPTQVAPGGAVIIEEPRANEAEGGVALISVAEFSPDGQQVGSAFEPTTGLLLLPLPVNSGEQYRSVANDPKTGQSIVHDAQVLGRQRIDACGEVIDGWEVEATQVRSDNESTTYNYIVATQYGGLLIQEGQMGETAAGGSFDLTFTLGQLDPDDAGVALMIDKYLPENPALRGLILTVLSVGTLLLFTQFIFPGSGTGGRGTPGAILFSGFTFGATIATTTAGLILVYRSVRIINFAQVAVGSLGGVIFWDLVQYTEVPMPVALLLGLAVGILTGTIVGAFLLRFFNGSRLFITVVTIVMAQASGQYAAQLRNLAFTPHPSDRSSFDNELAQNSKELLPFSGWDFQVGDLALQFGFNDVLAIELAVITFVGLMVFFRYTKAGIAVRGLAENSERASLLGIGVGGVSLTVWGLTGAIGFASAVGYGAISSQAAATDGFSFGVLGPAFVAAAIAGMSRFGVGAIAALMLGVLAEAWAFSFPDDQPTYNAILLVILSVTLLLQRQARTRSEDGSAVSWAAESEPRPMPREMLRIPSIRWARLGLIATMLAVVGIFPFVASVRQTVLMGGIALNTIAVLSLVVLTGWAGQVSLGQYAFVAIGAVVGGSISANTPIPFWGAVPLAAIVAGIIAMIVGIPALRIKGLFLLVVTGLFAVAVSSLLFNPKYFDWLLPDSVDRPSLFFFDFEDEKSMYFLCLGALIGTIGFVLHLRTTRVGRLLIAVRDNPANAQAFGVSPVRLKLQAFALSGAMAGFAGAILAHHQRAVTEASYGVGESLTLFLNGVVGGIGSVGGATLGSILFQSINDVVSSQLVATFFTYGGLFMVLFAFPGGLISAVYAVRDAGLRIIAQRRQMIVPALFDNYGVDDDDHTLVPLAEVEGSGGLASLPPERYALESELYRGRGVLVRDRIRPKKKSVDEAAFGAALAGDNKPDSDYEGVGV